MTSDSDMGPDSMGFDAEGWDQNDNFEMEATSSPGVPPVISSPELTPPPNLHSVHSEHDDYHLPHEEDGHDRSLLDDDIAPESSSSSSESLDTLDSGPSDSEDDSQAGPAAGFKKPGRPFQSVLTT